METEEPQFGEVAGEYQNLSMGIPARFKPGQSGNPKGRPKGIISLKKLIRQVLEEKIVTDDGNKVVRGLLIVKAMIEKAESGDVSAFRAICERLEGMPTQAIDVTARPVVQMPELKLIGGKPLTFEIGSSEPVRQIEGEISGEQKKEGSS